MGRYGAFGRVMTFVVADTNIIAAMQMGGAGASAAGSPCCTKKAAAAAVGRRLRLDVGWRCRQSEAAARQVQPSPLPAAIGGRRARRRYAERTALVSIEFSIGCVHCVHCARVSLSPCLRPCLCLSAWAPSGRMRWFPVGRVARCWGRQLSALTAAPQRGAKRTMVNVD